MNSRPKILSATTDNTLTHTTGAVFLDREFQAAMIEFSEALAAIGACWWLGGCHRCTFFTLRVRCAGFALHAAARVATTISTSALSISRLIQSGALAGERFSPCTLIHGGKGVRLFREIALGVRRTPFGERVRH
jgi:hypothetical protein